MQKFPIFILITALLFVSGCSNTDNASAASKESTDGWVSLFDGKSLDGWRGYNGANLEGAWVVEDGVLSLINRTKNTPHANIITVGVYDDFDLRFDWKAEAGTNSGVMFHIGEGPKEPYLTGPEYQVLDNLGFRSGKGEPVGPKEHSASNYGIEAATSDVTKPIGEWNEGRILVKGNHVEYWLNGIKTAEYEMHSPKWDEQVANAKFSKWKDFATLGKGHIGLQDHGHSVWFRNLKIKEL
ncbi:MAG: DUF1080 domain-containing protein [Verrucomicrobia bacterium]|nr:DUF1080 domain-containing protein [Verrucomicrobiota bacterium]MDA1066172.1 DUF1080 domain-containing protein [Verrucomicrobiota bacterium]